MKKLISLNTIQELNFKTIQIQLQKNFYEKLFKYGKRMTTPEEDFDTWCLILVSVTDDLDSFSNVLPDYQRLLMSINETGSLPSPLSSRTAEFLNLIPSQILIPFLNYYTLEDEQYFVIIEVFQSLLEFASSQLKKFQEISISILESFFVGNHNINVYQYNPNYEIKESMISFFLSNHGYENLIEVLNSQDTSITNIVRISQIILSLKGEIENFNYFEFSNTLCHIFSTKSSTDLRSFPLNVVEPLISQLPKSDNWLQLFMSFLKSELFDKQLFALKQIEQTISSQFDSTIIFNFLKDNFDQIISIPPHQEFYPLLGSICFSSLKMNLLSFEKIAMLWNTQEYVHQSELPQFYSMFLMIAKQIPEAFSTDFAKLILKPKSRNKEWLMVVNQTCIHYMKPNFKPSFFELRNELYRCGFIDISDISLLARQYLVFFSNYEINQIIPLILAANDFIVDRMHIISLIINSKEEIEKVDEVLSFCFEFIDVKPASSNITKICARYHKTIDDTQLAQLMKNPECITELHQSGIIDNEKMDNYFLSLTEITNDNSTILLNYVHKQNTFPLNSLPFEKEELLWRITIQSQNRQLSAGICNIYACNDGNFLTDYAMIHEFIKTFEFYYNESSNKQFMYQFLTNFIQTIETNADLIDFKLNRHKPSAMDRKIEISLHQIQRSFFVTYGNSLLVAVNRILQLLGKPIEIVFVTFNGQNVLYNSPVFSLKEPIVAEYTLTEPNPNNANRHLVRKSIPSLEIFDLKLSLKLVNDLKDFGCVELRELLNKLPTNKHLMQRIDNIKKMTKYDFASLFLLEYPYYSVYVFESLFSSNVTFDELNRTGFFDFIFDSINHFRIQEQIDCILFYFMDSCSVEQIAQISDRLFEFLLKLAWTQNLVISMNAVNLIGKLNPKIPEYEDFEPLTIIDKSKNDFNPIHNAPISQFLANIIVAFVFGNKEITLREVLSTQFSNLNIPLEYFTSHLSLVDEFNYCYLLTIMKSQLSIPNKALAEFALENFVIESPIFEFTIQIFLEELKNGQIEKNDQLNTCFEYLINYFLKADHPAVSPIISNTAFSILSQAPYELLSNHFKKLFDIKLTEFNIDGNQCLIQKSTTGLKNLGLSCFMNASLQQFFAIPSVRKAILEYNEQPSPENSNELNNTIIFINELKKLFGRMRDSYESFVSAQDLVDKWITWDGSKLNPRIQQDASEVVQMLIDKLELAKVIPKSTFNGHLVQVIENIDVEEPFKATRNESFSILPVQIAPTLAEGFDKIHLPDYFTGKNQYYAESLNKKVDAKKVEYLADDLPDHLIIQLKRFEFEYTTYERHKINSPVIITETIDLSKHILTSAQNVNSVYTLSGIIIHIGVAEGGHYISYIKQRETGKWFEYNDSIVTQTTFDDVLYNSNLNDKTAYLLFYDRANKIEIDDSQLDHELQNEIQERNDLYQFYNAFCSTSFTYFVMELSTRPEFSHFVIQYVINILPHLHEHQNLNSILVRLKGQLENNKKLCQFYLDSFHNLKSIFFDMPQTAIKDKLFELILSTIFNEISISESVFSNVMDLFEHSILRFNESQPYFSILLCIVKKNKELAEKFEVRKKIEDAILSIVETNTQIGMNDNLESVQTMFSNQMKIYRTLPFSDPVSILLELKPSIHFLHEIETNPELFKMFIMSFSNSQIYMKLYDETVSAAQQTENNQNILINGIDHRTKCVNLVTSFLSKYSIYLNMPLVCGLIFVYLHEEAISFFKELKFKTKGSFFSIADIAFCYVLLAHNDICNSLLIENFEKWFIPLSLNENYDCRIMINHAIGQIIHHTIFDTELGPVLSRDEFDYPNSEFIIVRKDTIDEEMKRISTLFLTALLNNLDKVKAIIEKDIPNRFVTVNHISEIEKVYFKSAQYRCSNYLKMIFILTKLVEVDLTPLIEFSRFLVNHSHPYDPHVRYTLKALNNSVTDDVIQNNSMKLFEHSDPNASLSRLPFLMNKYLSILIDILHQKTELNDNAIENLARNVLFLNSRQFCGFLELIPNLARELSRINSRKMMEIIDSDFNEICSENITAVCFVLDSVKAKRHIINYRDSLICKSIPYDAIIRILIEHNSGPMNNPLFLFWMLNTDQYSAETRKAMWQIIMESNVNYDSFNFNYAPIKPNDQIELTKYFLSRFNLEDNTNQSYILGHLYDLSQKSPDSFRLAFPLLKSQCPDHLKRKDFMRKVCDAICLSNLSIFDVYYKEFIVNSLSINEIYEYFQVMIGFVTEKLFAYNEILTNPIKGAFEEENVDLDKVVGYLGFMHEIHLKATQEIKEFSRDILEKLENEEILNLVDNESVQKLKESLRLLE